LREALCPSDPQLHATRTNSHGASLSASNAGSGLPINRLSVVTAKKTAIRPKKRNSAEKEKERCWIAREDFSNLKSLIQHYDAHHFVDK